MQLAASDRGSYATGDITIRASPAVRWRRPATACPVLPVNPSRQDGTGHNPVVKRPSTRQMAKAPTTKTPATTQKHTGTIVAAAAVALVWWARSRCAVNLGGRAAEARPQATRKRHHRRAPRRYSEEEQCHPAPSAAPPTASVFRATQVAACQAVQDRTGSQPARPKGQARARPRRQYRLGYSPTSLGPALPTGCTCSARENPDKGVVVAGATANPALGGFTALF